MIKFSKKGFTLIELLAVIIILSIVALIATPIIMNVVEDAKKSAGHSEANMILKGINNYCDQEMMGFYETNYCNDGITLKNNLGNIINLGNSKILEIDIENKELKWLLVECNSYRYGLINGKMDIETIEKPLDIYSDNSGANVPELLGLTPIKFDGSKWIYADVKQKWYDYEKKEWANAVLLNKSKTVGDEIKEEDIDLWYVWVPRYKYQLFDSSIKNQQINIEFEKNINSTGEVKCVDKTVGKQTVNNILSEECTNDITGNWYTHPAFNINGKQLKGIWVGKFEISSENNQVRMKPNRKSLLNTSLSKFKIMLDGINDKYKINTDNHIMRNMEWGAVSYLSQSKFGLCNKSVCNNIRRNNNSEFKTGYGAATDNETTNGNTENITQLYNTIEGVKSSTTQNIYGIYDMSGGAWEYTTGNIVDQNNNFYSSGSGFKTNLDIGIGYYDSYSYDTSSGNYSRGKLGDATKETKGWYGDFEYFPNVSYGWSTRGGNCRDGVKTGLNAMDADNGAADPDVTTRGVLSSK